MAVADPPQLWESKLLFHPPQISAARYVDDARVSQRGTNCLPLPTTGQHSARPTIAPSTRLSIHPPVG